MIRHPRKRPLGEHRALESGFSLVELLIYVGLFSVLFFAIGESIRILPSSYRELAAIERLEVSGMSALDVMLREIRDASAVSVENSSLGVHPGMLYLNTSSANGATRTVEFYLEGSRLNVKEDGLTKGPLTAAGVLVSNMVFYHEITPHSQGVKIWLTLAAGSGASQRSASFYGTAVLRDSY